jgi:hypothetical protein
MYPDPAEAMPAGKQANSGRQAQVERLRAYRNRFDQAVLAIK